MSAEKGKNKGLGLTGQKREIITGSFLFNGLFADAAEKGNEPPRNTAGESVLGDFLDSLEVTRFEADRSIYTEESFRRSICFVLSGTAYARNGDVPLNSFGAGDCFGAAALFTDDERYVTDVYAKTACEVVFITDTQLTGLFYSYPKTAVNYISFLSDRIRFLNRKISAFTVPSVEMGIVQWIKLNCVDGVCKVNGGYSALARQLNIGRASLYRTLEKLESRGATERNGRSIAVINNELL
jgi:CRP-like cAMP-binding protein